MRQWVLTTPQDNDSLVAVPGKYSVDALYVVLTQKKCLMARVVGREMCHGP